MAHSTSNLRNGEIFYIADSDVSASGEVLIGAAATPVNGEEYQQMSLTCCNEDTSYTIALKIQVADTPTVPGDSDADWVSLTDDFGLATFTVAVSGTFAAYALARHKWWRIYATASSASYGSNFSCNLYLSR